MTLVVRAGQYVDVVAGAVLADRRILVDGERVSAVLGPRDAAPRDAEVLDLTDCTVMPGLVGLHTHLVGPVEEGDLAAVIDRTPAGEALDGVGNARATLAAGITTVRDVGTFWAFVDVALARAIDDGIVQGPRMQCAGGYLTKRGGGGDITGVPQRPPAADHGAARDVSSAGDPRGDARCGDLHGVGAGRRLVGAGPLRGPRRRTRSRPRRPDRPAGPGRGAEGRPQRTVKAADPTLVYWSVSR